MFVINITSKTGEVAGMFHCPYLLSEFELILHGQGMRQVEGFTWETADGLYIVKIGEAPTLPPDEVSRRIRQMFA